MIDYNKYVPQQSKPDSSAASTFKKTSHCRQKIKLTKENRAFLKSIGLLK